MEGRLGEGATGATHEGQDEENKSEDEGWAEPKSQRLAESREQGDEAGELCTDGEGGNGGTGRKSPWSKLRFRSRGEFPFAEPVEQLVGPRRGEFAGTTEPEAVRAFFVDVDGGEPASLAEGGGEEQGVFDGD